MREEDIADKAPLILGAITAKLSASGGGDWEESDMAVILLKRYLF